MIFFFELSILFLGFSGDLDCKESTCTTGDLGSTPGWGISLEEGMAIHSRILAWKIPMDRGAWQATVHSVSELDTTEHLSTELSFISSLLFFQGTSIGVQKTACNFINQIFSQNSMSYEDTDNVLYSNDRIDQMVWHLRP